MPPQKNRSTRKYHKPAAPGIGWRALLELALIIGLPMAIALPLTNLIIQNTGLLRVLFLFIYPLLVIAMIAVVVACIKIWRRFRPPMGDESSSSDDENSDNQ